MLRPRVIPCLLVKDGGLVKTQKFDEPKYVGDPINAVKIFNEKEVDELIVIDIDATMNGREPDYTLIKNLAAECNMPLCYGGGVTSTEQIDRIISLGVEKVAMSSTVLSNPDVVSRSAEIVGGQSVVAVMDVKKSRFRGRYELYTHNGTQKTGVTPVDFARRAQDLGAGEIVINSIARDGMMQGYDLELVETVRNVVTLPITVLGGAGSLSDIGQLIDSYEIIGAAAGSLFVFKGVYRAVLISYPSHDEKDRLSQSD